MSAVVTFIYLIAAVMFILGIKMLGRVKTARNGNILAGIGMLLAVIATLVSMEKIGWAYIIIGVVVGGGIGAVMSIKVKMTGMPQLVAFFNGMGGGASVLVALSYFIFNNVSSSIDLVTVILSIFIGMVTFTGSIIAFGKLQELITGNPIVFKGNHVVNAALFLGILGLAGWMIFVNADFSLFLILIVVAGILGILLVIPIGGADMPVVIALLNSYSGLAAAATGFVLKNDLLIISGSLVGASGIILTRLMCKAMNRSLINVLVGGFGGQVESSKNSGYKNVKSCSSEEVAMLLDGVSSVVFVPGYGMAVAQAQHIVRELGELLEKKGVKVTYAIHPVAGRMPGHMNVLLAEANIPYEKLLTLEQANPEFKNTDVVIVIGANDVVNPAAINDKTSPIYGMPILNVHEAKTVIVVKRSLSPGFAGIENKLFDNDNTLMLFADGKKAIQEIVQEIKEA